MFFIFCPTFCPTFQWEAYFRASDRIRRHFKTQNSDTGHPRHRLPPESGHNLRAGQRHCRRRGHLQAAPAKPGRLFPRPQRVSGRSGGGRRKRRRGHDRGEGGHQKGDWRFAGVGPVHLHHVAVVVASGETGRVPAGVEAVAGQEGVVGWREGGHSVEGHSRERGQIDGEGKVGDGWGGVACLRDLLTLSHDTCRCWGAFSICLLKCGQHWDRFLWVQCHWLIDWWIYWMVDWLIDWLIDWSINQSTIQ